MKKTENCNHQTHFLDIVEYPEDGYALAYFNCLLCKGTFTEKLQIKDKEEEEKWEQ